MKPNQPVNARTRLAIAQWPVDAPRGSVTTFCAGHADSGKTFYAIRARARAEGQAAALQSRSRHPKTPPTQIAEALKDEALKVRAALESSGPRTAVRLPGPERLLAARRDRARAHRRAQVCDLPAPR